MIPPLLYTFIGATTAVKLHLTNAATPADAAALAACDQLQAASEALLAACGDDVSDEQFKNQYANQVVSVLEAVETLRQSPAAANFNSLLNSLLEYFYGGADSLMGGGTDPVVWPSSLGGSVKKPKGSS